jgi:hypothetical protein
MNIDQILKVTIVGAGKAQRTRDRRGRHGIVSRTGYSAAPATAAALGVGM